ncbi:MAG TPA: lysophospholipid acyltransferase family protein [Vicinamibacterales bacterium]|jgi:1-acyl-sn-glycerol-3-phosphate acyltransferase|nr:lysophospholipid acyltransferase family protein [Vicinamibacterales bacterium]
MIATTLTMVSRLISGATVHWHGGPPVAGQRIYFGNHSSHLDFIVIWSALPADLRRLARPVAGSDYWEQGAVRRYLAEHVFHAVLIQRARAGSSDPPAAARASIERIADEMGDQNSLIVFPEGTRRLNGEIGNFKSGLYHLSRLRPDVELIPVYLDNLNRILPKGEVLPVPMLSRVVFGPALVTNINEDKQAFLARAREALIRLRVMQ